MSTPEPRPGAPRTIAEYIAKCPAEIQARLERLRQAIQQAAPGAEEAIRYRIPTYLLDGNLVSFAACKGYIGLYPAPKGSPELDRKLKQYRAAKATLRFPLAEPLPLGLIRQVVRCRARELEARKARAGRAQASRSR